MHCPVCRAENHQGPQCRRCRVNLELLFALEDQRQRVLDAACRALGLGQNRRALALAEGAETLRADDESRALLAIVHLLRCDYARAYQLWRAASAAQPSAQDEPRADLL